MRQFTKQAARPGRRLLLLGAGLVLALLAAGPAFAGVLLAQLSTDPYANPNSQHKTEVEPDTFAYGSTIVSTFQVGRIFDGGASNIGWATSTDNGRHWTHGFLPNITVNAGGPYQAVSDPSVAYDAAHHTWLISTLPIAGPDGNDSAATSASTDGGLTWQNPVLVVSQNGLDKPWVACDNTASSPYYGHCYEEWDDAGGGDIVHMSTSTDGGQHWGRQMNTADTASGLGGQPLVQPNGTVIVPFSADSGNIDVFRSTNGGASWSSTTTIGSVFYHPVAGNLRDGGFLPTAEIDHAGNVYVAWQDCRFRTGCTANDIVLSSSANGLTWSAATRIPIDPISSTVDHFIPGLGVDKTTAGGTAHLGLTYYYYPVANCTSSTCQLKVGFVSSVTGGASWNTAVTLAGPISLSWIANSSLGRMVGDYISTSFSADGKAHPTFAVGHAPAGSTYDEAMYQPLLPLAVVPGSASVPAGGDRPVPSVTGQHIPAGPRHIR